MAKPASPPTAFVLIAEPCCVRNTLPHLPHREGYGVARPWGSLQAACRQARSPRFSEEHLKAAAKAKQNNSGPQGPGSPVLLVLSLHTHSPPNTHTLSA